MPRVSTVGQFTGDYDAKFHNYMVGVQLQPTECDGTITADVLDWKQRRWNSKPDVFANDALRHLHCAFGVV